jgi:transcriptional regulator with XRE-family HTH domain
MVAVRHRFMQNVEAYQLLLGRLRELRDHGGHGQKALAAALNISRPQYTSLETGKSMLSVDQLIGIARFYKVSVSLLVDGVL